MDKEIRHGNVPKQGLSAVAEVFIDDGTYTLTDEGKLVREA